VSQASDRFSTAHRNHHDYPVVDEKQEQKTREGVSEARRQSRKTNKLKEYQKGEALARGRHSTVGVGPTNAVP
jgi:hypothetical protein